MTRKLIFTVVCGVLIASGLYQALTNMEFLKLLIGGAAGFGLGFVFGKGYLERFFGWVSGDGYDG